MTRPRPLPEPAQVLLARYATSAPLWPGALVEDREDLPDRFRGALLWGAVGDALGRSTEARSWEAIRRRWGPQGVTTYQPWRGWQDGPIGTWTDDTQLTIEVAETILESGGHVDPERLSERLRAWLPHGRGKGRATTSAILAMEAGVPWWEAGPAVDSAGNGAAMRAAPVGLAWSMAPDAGPLGREAVLSALPTHAHPVGVAGAVAIAAGVALCIRNGGVVIEPHRFLAFVADAVAGIETEPTPLRSDPAAAVTLHQRILEVGSLLDVEPRDVFAHFWSGAFALESVPAALYCFLRSPERPGEVLLIAANAGHDTDTIASMAGNLVGAHVGANRLRAEHAEWWDELEGRDELIDLADGLLEVAIADPRRT
jgi:ADP-ribosyl-[dinitrogen reductase] hydrolase